jgi:adenylate cyclase
MKASRQAMLMNRIAAMKKSETSRHLRSSVLTGLLIAVLLAALPVAVWMDLTNLAEAALRRQASDLNSVISSVRSWRYPGST